MFGGSFKEAVKRDPLVRLFRKLTAPPEPAQWNYNKARKYLDYQSRDFNYSLAIAHFKEAIRLSPEHPLYHCSLGEALLSAPSMAVIRGIRTEFSLKRAVELAIPELQKAIRLAPEFAWPYYLLAVAYEYQGQIDKARQICRQAASVNMPEEARTVFEAYLKALDEYHNRVRDSEKVRQAEEECLRRLKRVMELRDAGKYKEAAKEFQEVAKISPRAAWLYDTLCRLGSPAPL
ncbi:MAG: tetratricopeptide repeat protein [Dehalococcoidia bacterium]|nr:tetratricopeptide repeat protein [Dehalococcoidia bacterium]